MQAKIAVEWDGIRWVATATSVLGIASGPDKDGVIKDCKEGVERWNPDVEWVDDPQPD